jgi:hypothetical protein
MLKNVCEMTFTVQLLFLCHRHSFCSLAYYIQGIARHLYDIDVVHVHVDISVFLCMCIDTPFRMALLWVSSCIDTVFLFCSCKSYIFPYDKVHYRCALHILAYSCKLVDRQGVFQDCPESHTREWGRYDVCRVVLCSMVEDHL